MAAAQAPSPMVEPRMTIAAATRACLDVTGPAGIDEPRLRSAGWEAYDIELGEASDSSLRIYNHGRGPVLLAGPGEESEKSGCIVIAPLTAGLTFDTVAAAISTEFRVQPTERKAAEVIWVMGDKGVLLALAGGKIRPAVNVTVVQNVEGIK